MAVSMGSTASLFMKAVVRCSLKKLRLCRTPGGFPWSRAAVVRGTILAEVAQVALAGRRGRIFKLQFTADFFENHSCSRQSTTVFAHFRHQAASFWGSLPNRGN